MFSIELLSDQFDKVKFVFGKSEFHNYISNSPKKFYVIMGNEYSQNNIILRLL